MRGAVIYGPKDVRFEEYADPKILAPTDAIVRTVATCICGSDLWRFRGVSPVVQPRPIGHEYVGVVEEVGSQVTSLTTGQFVVGSFVASDNTCELCLVGYQSACLHREPVDGCQAEFIRVPLADGTLVATPKQPAPEYIPSLLACSDVMGTGWYAAIAAQVRPDSTVVVVGDGAVGLCAVLAARQLRADRIIAMSRNTARQELATQFGATDIVTERGQEGIAAIKELTGGIGADSVLECVGTHESMQQSLGATRPGGNIGFVGVPHGVHIRGEELFSAQVALRGGSAPVRRFLPDLIDGVLQQRINPGKVFDVTLPLEEVAEGYRAMDERRAIKVLLRP
ncbi:MAG: zinc-dependent alcohol dehydrogenase family protein [Corynebacteriales bacterium]|nr:zinc-dependent alcohol dehydrogenase family protein [Mycobacteriales bacterium]